MHLIRKESRLIGTVKAGVRLLLVYVATSGREPGVKLDNERPRRVFVPKQHLAHLQRDPPGDL
ncbi:hypothetical protein EYF80_064253 [Liparis tanakae]|uniref:Uncharacterized protein n=1 Tax=Liparis tanakae TaxID=230148 RepID=A0A4Z2E9S8_9TELE|nr:hypothetical protein EYF80_064253 [Liparis tanakae]